MGVSVAWGVSVGTEVGIGVARGGMQADNIVSDTTIKQMTGRIADLGDFLSFVDIYSPS